MTTKATLAALCAVAFAQAATAQTWPAKPVRLITGFAAGGSSDQVARLIADRLSASLGQQFIVDNRSGGNGVVGASIAAKAAPDGYSFLVVFDSHATNPALQKTLPYDTAREFVPIMLIASSPFGLVVGAAQPYRTLGDLIAAAKSNPGGLTQGTSGVGSRAHLAMTLLGQKAGFQVTQVPYRGPAQAMVDVIGGQVTMQMVTVFFLSPFVKSQRVRAIAVASPARLPQWPDVPTIAEQGFPGYDVQSWWGIVAPAGLPRAILRKMHTELSRALTGPEMRDRLEQLGTTVRASTPDEFSRYIDSEMSLWGKVARDSHISSVQ